MQITEATALEPLLATITILGSGRLGPTLAAVIGLVGAVIGGRALARARDRASAGTAAGSTTARNGATEAVVLGLVSLGLGGLFLAAADGGPGTGNGVVGSIAALVLGPIAIALGGLARTRGRVVLRSSTSSDPLRQTIR